MKNNKVYFHVNNSVKVILPRVSTMVCLNYVHVLYNVVGYVTKIKAGASHSIISTQKWRNII